MRFVSLSDIHIHQHGDDGWRLLETFAAHPLVREATHVGLLGDVFDLMAGDHPAYLTRHHGFFNLLREWCEAGKTVFWAEGNHDMHLGGLARRATADWSPAARARLVALREDKLITLGTTTMSVGHGDRFDPTDHAYLAYRRFIDRRFWRFVADHVMPYGLLNWLGERASRRSRAHGYQTFDEEAVRARFRAGVTALAPAQAKIVVGGHSHVSDVFQWEGRTYLNNGFPRRSGKFVVVDEGGPRLESL